MDYILKPTVLCLNAGWQATGHRSIKKAIISMCADAHDESGVLGMDIEYPFNELTGEYDFDNPNIVPTKWEDWINLPIRPYDTVVHGACRNIRAPTVVIAVDHHKMPMVEKSPTKSAIFERDGGRCQYTGKVLTRKQANIDHVIPRDRWSEVKGNAEGLNHWENLVLCDKNINSRKGNKLNEEAGLKLLRKPVAPPPMPVVAYIREIKHKDWSWFLGK
jgi:5-methylcytosine-specific restriction endonuclease McrA